MDIAQQYGAVASSISPRILKDIPHPLAFPDPMMAETTAPSWPMKP